MGNNKERVIIYSLSIMMLMAGFSGLFILDDNVLGSDVKDQPTAPPEDVENLDTGETFRNIQDAISDADTWPGHTIFVGVGTYAENVNVNKAITVLGEDVATTTVTSFTATVDGVSIIGFTTTASPGIGLDAVQGCTIADNIVQGSAGSGSGIFLSYSDGNTIERNDVSVSPVAEPWRYGIFIDHSNNNYFDGNIGANNWATMRMDYCTGNTFRNNVMTNDGIAILGYTYSYYDHDIDTSNTVNGNPIYYWKNVVGGTVPEGAGQIYLVNCENVIVENQNTEMSATGIDLVLSTGCTVRDCTVRNSYFGIDLLLSDGCYVTNNDVRSPGLTWGINIWIRSSINSFIEYNTVSNDGTNPAGDAIIVDAMDRTGAYLAPATDNVFAYNTVSLANYGIVMRQWVAGNLVYHNNFMTGTINGQVDADSNFWDDGYPTGGNYWVDYTGIDSFSGPNQDIAGSDGIGDTPMQSDNYPLMELVVPSTGPEPPVDVWAELRDNNVNISWTLSADDASLDRYEIYRGTSFDDTGAGYSYIGQVSAGIGLFEDIDAGYGDTNNYYYYVRAVDASEDFGNSETQGGKNSVSVNIGWNMASTPLALQSGSPESVMQILQYRYVKYYDPTNFSDPWKTYSPLSSPSVNDLSNIDRTMGLWIYALADDQWVTAGQVPDSTDIDLNPGWNLVSYPSATNELASDSLLGKGVDWISIYDSVAPFVIDKDDLSTVDMSQGNAYWVHVDAFTVWTVDY